MITVGAYNTLRVAKYVDFGLYLTDGEQEILLPAKYAPRDLAEGDPLRVFVYMDSEDRIIATTLRPKGVVGDFVALEAKEVTPVGAFMDWGLDKDLLVPFRQQSRPMQAGRIYVVRILLDEVSNRLIGSTKLAKHLAPVPANLPMGESVDALIYDLRPDGARAVVDNTFSAAIFADDIHVRLNIGDRRRAYVKRVREDGQVALALTPQGYSAAIEQADLIMERLHKEGGFLPYSDESSPEEIRKVFGISKGTFKKAVGKLMKEGRVEMTYHGLRAKP